MAQQIIDNTLNAGEAAQTAFGKCNSNFTELYANLVIPTFSNVTITPISGTALTINGGAGVGTALLVTGASAVPVAAFSGTDIGIVQIFSTSAASRAAIVFGNSGAIARIGADGTQNLLSDSTNGDLCIVSAGQAVRFGTVAGGTTKMVLSTAGNLTVFSPTTGLAINAVGASAQVVVNATTVGVGTAFQANGPAATQMTALSVAQTGQTNWALYQPASSNDLRFFAGSDRLTITSNGATAINCSSGTGLSVNGIGTNVAAFIGAPSTFAASLTIAGAGNAAAQGIIIQQDTASNGFIRNLGTGALFLGTGAANWVTIAQAGTVAFGASIGINGTAAPAQPTGYGTPTGGSRQASFAAGSITLPNLAAAVAQLIIDLKAYGILGT